MDTCDAEKDNTIDSQDESVKTKMEQLEIKVERLELEKNSRKDYQVVETKRLTLIGSDSYIKAARSVLKLKALSPTLDKGQVRTDDNVRMDQDQALFVSLDVNLDHKGLASIMTTISNHFYGQGVVLTEDCDFVEDKVNLFKTVFHPIWNQRDKNYVMDGKQWLDTLQYFKVSNWQLLYRLTFDSSCVKS